MEVIDQTRLPNELLWVELRELGDFCRAIETMQVRGAPLIGITAAYGLALALAENASSANTQVVIDKLLATRPTAVNLAWALARVQLAAAAMPAASRAQGALQEAQAIAAEDVAVCHAIGMHGLELLRALAAPLSGRALQVMTHCNAGWLAALEWGTALAPVYLAHQAGMDIHVWVSETRPRNQGSNLTTWELANAGIAHTVIADNAAGHMLQQGLVDCCLVGSDRTVANGDVCNKVGTYLKALAAHANSVPFYVALPTASIDWACPTGGQVPIEQRSGAEVLSVTGRDGRGEVGMVALANRDTRAFNPAFDVTPAALVSAIITELGVVAPADLQQLKTGEAVS